MNNKKKFYYEDNFKFGKEESKKIATFSVLLMLILHLFNFPNWLNEGNNFHSCLGPIGDGLTKIISRSGGLCVPIFAIISGYALYINQNSFKNWDKRLKKILKFIGSYWLVYLIFIIIAYINDDGISNYKNFLLNLFAINYDNPQNVTVAFAWYVTFYIEFILISPFILKIFNKKNYFIDFISFISVCIFSYFVISNKFNSIIHIIVYRFYPIIFVTIGLLIAKYNILEQFHKYLFKKLPLIFFPIVVLYIFCFKFELSNFNKMGGLNWKFFIIFIDGVISCFLISIFLEIINRYKNKYFNLILLYIGNLSMYIWYLHSIFFTGKNFMQDIIYFFKEPFLILISCLIIVIPISNIISYIYINILKLLYYINIKLKLSYNNYDT